MKIIIVVSQEADWQLNIPGVEVVPARTYLTDPAYSKLRGVKVFNLCRNYRYQSSGYYVSLLAEARGHKPLPTVSTIQDIKSPTIIRLASDEFEELIAKSLADVPPSTERLILNFYFGQIPEEKYNRVCNYLFKSFQAPLLRAYFAYDGTEKKWELKNVNPIPASEIPAEHHDFAEQAARDYFDGKRVSVRKKSGAPYDLAILHGSPGSDNASDDKAIQRTIKAAEAVGFDTELIQKDDYGRLAEFDALYIRETTNVNHYTYRFARRAAAEGLVVIDDPESILKCTNKVYLAELMERHKIAGPKTLIVHRDNMDEVANTLGFPCILKQPDSSFSQGVSKAENVAELQEQLTVLFDKSDLVIAQEFMPTEFDWRIGVLDRKPLFACKYYMARKHWQILRTDGSGKWFSGKVETLPVELAPRKVVRTALAAANLIGDGLYGVDLKEIGSDVYVIEVNDNPNLDSNNEDGVLREELYMRLMEVFFKRVERRKNRQS